MPDRYSLVEFDQEDPIPVSEGDVSKIELGELLGCENLRTRVWYLEPDGSLMYHKQSEQEELYVPLGGPGQLRIEDHTVDVEEGAAVRVPPQTPRQPINTGEQQQVWLIIGAPAAEDDGIILEDQS